MKPRMLAPSTSAVSIAILISYASTFLPRYSGVRPTIRPAMKTARMAPMTSMPYMPAPMPPGVISPSSMLNSGTRPGDRLGAVVPGVDRAGARAGRDGHEQATDRRPEAGLLALHVAEAGLVDAGREQRVADVLDVHRADRADEQDDRHRREDRPALALAAGVLAERVGQRERAHQEGEDLEPVRERRRALERMGRVGVEEAAAVVAQLLDPLLRGDGADGDGLRARPGGS